jgi:rubrerythrin
MKNFSKTQTEKNLEAAFAGESMANRKYLYFAKIARKLGNIEVAELFEDIAQQETGHAFSHLALMYPEKEMTVEKLLEIAAEGELYETHQMYPEFERIAVEEGQAAATEEFKEQAQESQEHASLFINAARRFKSFTKIEAIHANTYLQALETVRANSSILP